MLKLLTVTFFTLILASFLSGTVLAAAKKLPATVKIDTSKITVKKFDAHALEKFKADKDFYYNGQSTGEPSFWDLFWNWLWNTISRWFGRIPYGGYLLKYLFIVLSVAFLLYVIFKSLGISPMKLLRGDAQKVDVPYSESLENIHEINFDTEIEKAISQHNYRLAVRLLYLKCLKQLSDSNLIRWQIDKTNAAYLYELTDANQKETFELLTRQFEYVWYGNFAIDKQAFGNINQLFQNFKKQLP
jgi:hypothetical protein